MSDNYIVVNKRRYVVNRGGISFVPGKNVFAKQEWELLREVAEIKLQILKGVFVLHGKPDEADKKEKPAKPSARAEKPDFEGIDAKGKPVSAKVKKDK